jgi:hypothetical protein
MVLAWYASLVFGTTPIARLRLTLRGQAARIGRQWKSHYLNVPTR